MPIRKSQPLDVWNTDADTGVDLAYPLASLSYLSFLLQNSGRVVHHFVHHPRHRENSAWKLFY